MCSLQNGSNEKELSHRWRRRKLCFTLNYHLSSLNFLSTTASGGLQRLVRPVASQLTCLPTMPSSRIRRRRTTVFHRSAARKDISHCRGGAETGSTAQSLDVARATESHTAESA